MICDRPMASGTGSPCGACKFLRRKCVADCIFAPYFCSDQGPARFAAIHKVFGASNVSKLLLLLPVHHRYAAVVTIAYEAQARLKDPIYGCVAHIFALQQQVTYLQAQLMQVKAQLAQNLVNSRNAENQWASNVVGGTTTFPAAYPAYVNPTSSPQSSLDSIEHYNDGVCWQSETNTRDEVPFQAYSSSSSSRKRPSQTDLGELQALALRMSRAESHS